jgi:hypothetical protein
MRRVCYAIDTNYAIRLLEGVPICWSRTLSNHKNKRGKFNMEFPSCSDNVTILIFGHAW